VLFKVRLQRGNRVQVPRPIRRRFKLENSQVLRVNVCFVEARLCLESFYARIDKSGRITISKPTLSLLQNKANDGQSLTGAAMEDT